MEAEPNLSRLSELGAKGKEAARIVTQLTVGVQVLLPGGLRIHGYDRQLVISQLEVRASLGGNAVSSDSHEGNDATL
jgi:hypothetical protein